jgi:hypothetical protein
MSNVLKLILLTRSGGHILTKKVIEIDELKRIMAKQREYKEK